LLAKLGLFDATMIGDGRGIGSGIFCEPRSGGATGAFTGVILGAWLVGSVAGTDGAMIYAEWARCCQKQAGRTHICMMGLIDPGILVWVVFAAVINAGGTEAVVTGVRKIFFGAVTHADLGAGAGGWKHILVLAVINCLACDSGATCNRR